MLSCTSIITAHNEEEQNTCTSQSEEYEYYDENNDNILTEEDLEDKRRTLRMRRSSLINLNLDELEKPSIKIAENLDEYQQSFKIVFGEYVRNKYIEPRKTFTKQYTTHSLLPHTCVFVFKQYLKVIATLTQIFDSKKYGLPIDELYSDEIDILRKQGRRVVELSSFVTLREYRMRNIMIYLSKAMFKYSRLNSVDDICIMVNPKHVTFYTRMFLFEPFGSEKYYEKVKAPAVALRVDMKKIEQRLEETYSKFEYDEDLHRFFCRTNTTLDMLLLNKICHKKHTTPNEVLDFFQLPLKL